jgi:hypothetical protein
MKRGKTPSDIKRKRSARRSASPRRWILRDPEVLNLVFHAFEGLTTLQQRCARQVVDAQEEAHMIAGMGLNTGQSALRRWSRLSEIVTTNWRLLDYTVQTNRLDSGQFQEAYRQMLEVKTAWLRLEPQRTALHLIDQITDHLRQLLISYAQARRQPRRRKR